MAVKLLTNWLCHAEVESAIWEEGVCYVQACVCKWKLAFINIYTRLLFEVNLASILLDFWPSYVFCVNRMSALFHGDCNLGIWCNKAEDSVFALSVCPVPSQERCLKGKAWAQLTCREGSACVQRVVVLDAVRTQVLDSPGSSSNLKVISFALMCPSSAAWFMSWTGSAGAYVSRAKIFSPPFSAPATQAVIENRQTCCCK